MGFIDITLQLLRGFGTTYLLFALTLLLSLPLGLLFCFGSMSRFIPLRWLSRSVVYVIRGTPLLLQLFIVVYLPGILLDAPITKWSIFNGNVLAAYFFGALFAFVLNYSCYFSEIYRGGIESISAGQYEAGQVLGMTKRQIFFKVILLQVIKRILAPISNETVTLVKDTSLARSVTVYEMFFYANQILTTEALLWPLFYAGLFYLVFNALITWLFNKAEKKLSYFRA